MNHGTEWILLVISNEEISRVWNFASQTSTCHNYHTSFQVREILQVKESLY